MKAIKNILVATVGILMAASSVHATEIVRLSGPASMTDALKELISLYATIDDRAKIITNIGSSGAMAKQIREGAPADIYISANQKWMTLLREEQMIDPTSEKVLVFNKLVFVGEKNTEITSMADIVHLQRIAIGSPASVPAGEYAAQAMENSDIYAHLQQGNQLIIAKDVRQALVYADRGETEGAFVYITDALLATRAEILFTVPQELYEPVAYPMALTTAGVKNVAARPFYTFLASPRAMRVFSRYGFSAGQQT